MYGMLFLAWYVGATLFIMYRMKGDDLDSLEREVKKREQRKKELENLWLNSFSNLGKISFVEL